MKKTVKWRARECRWGGFASGRGRTTKPITFPLSTIPTFRSQLNMKTLPSLITLLATLAVSATAQLTSIGSGNAVSDGNATPQVTDRGPHHRTWSRFSYETNRQGQVITHTNTAYVELADGMHYRDPDTRQWVESDPRFEITPDGHALARRGSHQVILAPNINSTNAVDMQMPDGGRLVSRPVGLAFYDAVSGSNVMIATLKDCAGRWLPPNEVFYPDAFDGLHAGLRYTYSRQGLEQDVVLYENPGSPAAYGLDPRTTRLETWTEFFTAPTPRVKELPVEDGDEDERVEFGTTSLGQGRAYFMSIANRDEPSLPVKKIWRRIGDRVFLIEAVRYAAARPYLQRLAAVTPATDSMLARRGTTGRETLIGQVRITPTTEPKMLAAITKGQRSDEPSFVLDYTTLSTGLTNYIFQGDTTYYISGTINLSGTTRFEGGTVIKYAPTNSASLALNGPSIWLGEQFRPSVFTARDDDTVGEKITGSTGNPATNYYGNPMVLDTYRGSSPVLQGVRKKYQKNFKFQ